MGINLDQYLKMIDEVGEYGVCLIARTVRGHHPVDWLLGDKRVRELVERGRREDLVAVLDGCKKPERSTGCVVNGQCGDCVAKHRIDFVTMM